MTNLSELLARPLGWLNGIERNVLYRVMAGMLIAAFFNISLGMKPCFVPAFFLPVLAEGIKASLGKDPKFRNILPYLVGGLLINLFVPI